MPFEPAFCRHCRHPLNRADRFCSACGMAVTVPGEPVRRPFGLSPENASKYWRYFFRPFFITAFVFFAVFFLAAMCLVVAWFFMFHQ